MVHDYFNLFGLKPAFQVNLDSLRQTYLNLQKKFHPDKYTNHSQQEQLLAMQMSAQINQAYQTLNNDLLRGEYLLGNSSNSEHSTINDIEFLSLQMELREQLEQINNNSERDQFILEISVQTKQLTEQFSQIYLTDSDLATSILQKLQFFQKLTQKATKFTG